MTPTVTDDSSFFFKNKKYVIAAFKILNEFLFFSRLKPNKEKCEVVGITVKKGGKVALCRMKNIDLKKTQWNLSEFIILTTKNLNMKRISKTYTENRDCFENLEDKKFNASRENHNLQNSNFWIYTSCFSNSFT